VIPVAGERALDDIAEKAGLDTYGKVRSRFGGFPDVIGNLPATLLPKEITTPGERQIRAFFVSAGNPVLSVPDGDALERALGELEIGGLKTTKPLHLLLAEDVEVRKGEFHTRWLEPWLDANAGRLSS